MHSATRDLLNFLTCQRTEVFDITGRVDDKRYLGREFPAELPLIMSVQRYPAYRHMVGENWLHWHDYFECFVALSGEGDFCAGNDRILFKPGDIVVVDPLKIHGVMRMEATHSALVMLFPRRLIAPADSAVDEAFLAAWENRPSNMLPVLRGDHRQAPAVHEALLKLMQVWFGDARESERWMEVKLRFLEVLMKLGLPFAAKATAARNTSTNGDHILRESRLRRALDFVSLHGHGQLLQPEVAKAAGMSTSRFRAFFKETTGWGFARYLREQRVERAARLLRVSSESIASIAHRTGFADQSHLLRCFREKFGVSPKEYRRSHQTQQGQK